MSLIYVVIFLLAITGVQETAEAARQLAVGSASGTLNQTVLIPVSVDDTADLGGVAFTLYYNKDFFEFAGLEKSSVNISNGAAIRYNEIPLAFIARISFLRARIPIDVRAARRTNTGRKDLIIHPAK